MIKRERPGVYLKAKSAAWLARVDKAIAAGGFRSRQAWFEACGDGQIEEERQKAEGRSGKGLAPSTIRELLDYYVMRGLIPQTEVDAVSRETGGEDGR